jgi:hypothetical protein
MSVSRLTPVAARTRMSTDFRRETEAISPRVQRSKRAAFMACSPSRAIDPVSASYGNSHFLTPLQIMPKQQSPEAWHGCPRVLQQTKMDDPSWISHCGLAGSPGRW